MVPRASSTTTNALDFMAAGSLTLLIPLPAKLRAHTAMQTGLDSENVQTLARRALALHLDPIARIRRFTSS